MKFFLDRKSRIAIYITLFFYFLSAWISSGSKDSEGMAVGMIIFFFTIVWMVIMFCIFYFTPNDKNLQPEIIIAQKRWSHLISVSVGIFIVAYIVLITILVFLGIL